MEFHIGETGSQGAGEAGTLGEDVTRRWGCLLRSSGPSLLDSGAEDAESPVVLSSLPLGEGWSTVAWLLLFVVCRGVWHAPSPHVATSSSCAPT